MSSKLSQICLNFYLISFLFTISWGEPQKPDAQQRATRRSSDEVSSAEHGNLRPVNLPQPAYLPKYTPKFSRYTPFQTEESLPQAYFYGHRPHRDGGPWSGERRPPGRPSPSSRSKSNEEHQQYRPPPPAPPNRSSSASSEKRPWDSDKFNRPQQKPRPQQQNSRSSSVSAEEHYNRPPPSAHRKDDDHRSKEEGPNPAHSSNNDRNERFKSREDTIENRKERPEILVPKKPGFDVVHAGGLPEQSSSSTSSSKGNRLKILPHKPSPRNFTAPPERYGCSPSERCGGPRQPPFGNPKQTNSPSQVPPRFDNIGNHPDPSNNSRPFSGPNNSFKPPLPGIPPSSSQKYLQPTTTTNPSFSYSRNDRLKTSDGSPNDEQPESFYIRGGQRPPNRLPITQTPAIIKDGKPFGSSPNSHETSSYGGAGGGPPPERKNEGENCNPPPKTVDGGQQQKSPPSLSGSGKPHRMPNLSSLFPPHVAELFQFPNGPSETSSNHPSDDGGQQNKGPKK